MSDWIGLSFFVLFALGIFLFLKNLGKKRVRTEAEFEKNAAEGSTLLGIGAAAINGILNPSAEKGRVTVEQVSQGTFNKKKEDGKAKGPEDNNDR